MPQKFFKITILILLGVISNQIFSQNLLNSKNYIPEFNHLTFGVGVSHLNVISIIRDKHGFMWFCTDDGVYQFDGYNYKIFKNDPTDLNSILGNIVQVIFEDSRGVLWFGTTKGLNRFDYQTEKFQQFRHKPNKPFSLLGEEVYDIFEDRSGNLWVGTWGGLNLLNREDGTFKHFLQSSDSTTGLPDYRIMSINQDNWGVLWIATLNGLCAMYQDKDSTMQYVHYPHIRGDPSTLYGNSAYFVHIDKAGTMWVGTHSGFCKMNRPPPTSGDNGLSRVAFNRVLPKIYGKKDEIIWKIAEDNKGNLWLSSWGNGLICYNPQNEVIQRFHHIPLKPNSLSDNTVQSLYIDSQNVGNNLWIGTLHGVDAFFTKKRKFKLYRHDRDDISSISNNNIHSILKDTQGDLWIGTMEGLNRLRKGQQNFQHYFKNSDESNSLPANLILSIYEDKKGDIWIGTFEGLIRLDKKTERFVQDKNLIRIDDLILRVFTFCEDDDSEFWLGTRHGLIRYDRQNQLVTKYDQELSNPQALPNSEVRSLLLDSQGIFWVGTTGGLAIFSKDNDKFFRFYSLPEDPNGLSNPTIWKIFEDSEGGIWIATNGGLNKLVRNQRDDPSKWKFVHFTEDDGLASNYVSGILEDDSGYLWLSTSRGLSKFDPKTSVFKNYDSEDGLQSTDFSSVGYCKTNEGKLLFGGINGLNIFDPDSISDNTHVPPIVITEFRIFDKPVSLDNNINTLGEIELSYRENFFSFEFAALDYTQPAKNRYAYMMEGFDSDWIYSGSRRYASYTNLDPGYYIFHVKGSNNDGIWNEEGISLQITITPPFWKTWWFRFAILIIIGSILYSIHRYRIAKIREVEMVRARIAEDLHDEIASSLASVKLYSEVVQKQLPSSKKDTKDLLQRIRHISGEVSEGIGQVIWSVDPRHDNLSDLISYIERQSRQLFSAANITFHWKGPQKIHSLKLSPDERRTIYLIIKEAMTNILRHSNCSTTELTFKQEGHSVQFILKDDGKGFDIEKIEKGHGLDNMKKRALSIRAELSISSFPQKGTELCLKVKIA